MVAPVDSEMCSKAATGMCVVVIARFVIGVPTSWLGNALNRHRSLIVST
jgi:hypothetical protein